MASGGNVTGTVTTEDLMPARPASTQNEVPPRVEVTFGLFVAGHFSADLRNFDQVVDSPMAVRFARGLYWVLPNLAPFDVKAQVVHGQHVSAAYMALTIAYGVVYIGALLVAAVLVFSRRDFK